MANDHEMIIVTNNERRMMQVQVSHNTEDGLITLQPGTNDVKAAAWTEAKKLRTVQLWLKTETTNDDMDGRPPMVVEHDGLPALDAARADTLLRETFDKALLGKWLEQEKRPEIRLAIQRRIDEMARIEKSALAEAAAKGETGASANATGESGDASAAGADLVTATPGAGRGRRGGAPPAGG